MTTDTWAGYEAWQSFYGYPPMHLPSVVGSHRAITFPTTGLVTKCRIALGANLSDDWRTWDWLDISDRVRWQDGVTVVSGKRDRDPNVPASTATFTLTNIDGELSRQNVFSTLFGLLFKHNPIWMTVDAGNGEFDEFFGFTQELPKRSDRSGTDGRIHMTCKGPLDHIFRTKEVESPLRTACIAAAPTHLWTLEEEDTAGQASSALVGGIAMTQFGTIDWASSSTIVGAKPLPNLRTGSGSLVGALDQGITGGAPGYAFDHNYIVSVVTRPEDFGSGTFTAFQVNTENQGSISAWRLKVVNDGTLQLVSLDYGGVETVRSTSAVIPGIFTEPKLLTFTGQLLDVSTGDARFRMLVDNAQVTTTTLTEFSGNLMTGTLTASTASEAAPVGFFMAHHLDYFEDGVYINNVDTIPNGAEIVAAMTGHAGEMVHERVARICRQKRITFYTSAGVSQTLGPQPIDTPINVIRNAELVEGTVYEKEFGLAYKSQAEYYRQPVSLALDMAEGHINGELTPADDTTKFYNQWTITRSGGSSSTQQKDGGVSANEEVFSNQATLNVETDPQTAYLASYRANRDSSEADRWPFVQFLLQKHPTLIPTYQAMPFGSRVTVANMRTRWGVVSLDLTVEGKVVFFNSKRYEITLNSSDASIHNIGTLDGGQALDSRSLFLNADITTTATTMEAISRDEHERITTDSADYPVDIVMLGEQITAQSISEIAFDAYGRTSVDTWGVSDSGHTIVSLGGAGTDYDVNGGTGKQLLTSVNVMRHSVYALGSGLSAETYKDIEFYADVKITVTPTGNSISCWLTHRFQDVNNYYDAIILFQTDLTMGLAIGVRAGGLHTVITGITGTGILPLGPFTVGNFWRIQMRVMDNEISAKSWEVATQTEPSEYMVSSTPDGATNGIHPSGSDFALQSRLEPGNTNVNPTVEWDNLHVVNPQRLTVVRSVNGVVRAHPKGRQIRAYDPFILGL